MGVYIIAEAGVNHNGSFELACKLIEAAKEAGADCIKFQTFNSEKLVSQSTRKADYQKTATGGGTQLDMLKKLELSYDEFIGLKKYCDEIGITFLSTPFDFDSIDFLNTIDMPFWKIPSGIREAIKVLNDNGVSDIKLLHCNTEYPTPFEDVNLKAMLTIKDEFGCGVGYSDHTMGIEVPIAAVALGATVIEKHFTLDRNMEGPDHKASLEPFEFAEMVKSIRNIEKSLGRGEKTPSPSERKNMAVARKSIVANRKIRKGDVLTEDNITVKRPGTGINPMKWNNVLGTKAIRDFDEDELIEL